jgi:hypothetical protein
MLKGPLKNLPSILVMLSDNFVLTISFIICRQPLKIQNSPTTISHFTVNYFTRLLFIGIKKTGGAWRNLDGAWFRVGAHMKRAEQRERANGGGEGSR